MGILSQRRNVLLCEKHALRELNGTVWHQCIAFIHACWNEEYIYDLVALTCISYIDHRALTVAVTPR